MQKTLNRLLYYNFITLSYRKLHLDGQGPLNIFTSDKELGKIRNINQEKGRFNRCCSYGNPETTGEPGTVYATAKQNLDDDYRTIKERLEQRLSEAQSAKSTAYQKYSHYKSMADAESPY